MPTIVHFDMSADDVARARKFYQEMFDWSMFSPPGMDQYTLIETKDLNGNPGVGGGLSHRDDPSMSIVMYVGVDDIEKYIGRVEELGGKIVLPITPVPGWGWSAVCADTEGNLFGLWQDEAKPA